jgi:hypothetical protein
MTPRLLLMLTVQPALAWLGPRYASREAEALLLAIAHQESRCAARRQKPAGPARSWWQIESQTAHAVISKWSDGRSRLKDLGALTSVGLPGGQYDLSTWVECSELAACIIARGLLWLEPSPLPALGDQQGAWKYYAERTWRPGKPHPETWPDAYEQAMDAVAWSGD